MNDAVIAALITGGISFLGMVITSALSSNSSRRLMEYQIKEIKDDFKDLKTKVEKHNNVVERLAVVEQRVDTLQQKIDTVTTRD